jgi:hypothetical protein
VWVTDPLKVWILQFSEDPFPDASIRPAAESAIDRVPLSKGFRQVPPGRAGTANPENGVEKKAIIASRAAWIRLFPRKQAGDSLPIGVRNSVSKH